MFVITRRIPCKFMKFCKMIAVSSCYYSDLHHLQRMHYFYYEKLCKSLVRIAGDDADAFLQGIITNDVRHLSEKKSEQLATSMYSMMLNPQGKVLYDVIICRTEIDQHQPAYIIECDGSVKDDIIKHLRFYKLRKKVDINSMDNEWSCWVIFRAADCTEVNSFSPGHTLHESSVKETSDKIRLDIKDLGDFAIVTKDPRISSLGWRLMLRNTAELSQVIHNICPAPSKESSYEALRYRLGIGEGVQDLPPGGCFPLECNADYLHGVSFHKGCYIGQELTARTHHTGVVRKRLMPLKFVTPGCDVKLDAVVENEVGKNVGKIRGLNLDLRLGLGLLRIQDCLQAKRMLVQGTQVQVLSYKPNWWPAEAPKETLLTKS